MWKNFIKLRSVMWITVTEVIVFLVLTINNHHNCAKWHLLGWSILLLTILAFRYYYSGWKSEFIFCTHAKKHDIMFLPVPAICYVGELYNHKTEHSFCFAWLCFKAVISVRFEG